MKQEPYEWVLLEPDADWVRLCADYYQQDLLIVQLVLNYVQRNRVTLGVTLELIESFKALLTQKKTVQNHVIHGILQFFFNPLLKHTFPSPLLLKGMQEALTLVYEALMRGDRIGVLGDYDVDGITATSLWVLFFNAIGYRDYVVFTPDRILHGHGVSEFALAAMNELNSEIDCYIFVDCGTNSVSEIDSLVEAGKTVIVIDHHEPNAVLPKYQALINPKYRHHEQDLSYLCSAGLVFMTLVGLVGYLEERQYPIPADLRKQLLDWIDLVGLATVADVVPLVHFNRVLVKQAILKMQKKASLGLKALMQVARVNPERVGIYELGMLLAPRINAGGRVSDSSLGVKLFTALNETQAFEYASALDVANDKRKDLQQAILDKAVGQIETSLVTGVESDYSLHDPVILAVGDWNIGIVGIIASKLQDKFDKPAIVIGCNKDEYKGSVRSKSGLDVGKFLLWLKDEGVLTHAGGHQKAGGFSIAYERIPLLKKALQEHYDSFLQTNQVVVKYVDKMVALRELNGDFYAKLNYLIPFQEDNFEPHFRVDHVKLAGYYKKGYYYCVVVVDAFNPKYSQTFKATSALFNRIDGIMDLAGHRELSLLLAYNKEPVIVDIQATEWVNNYPKNLKKSDFFA